jgi:pimeloyl-ACP methyl ester carboxylesterase
MTVPTLLIEAQEGMGGGIDQGQYAARLAAHPAVERRRMPGGHHLHLEAGAPAVAEAIGAFLSTHLDAWR